MELKEITEEALKLTKKEKNALIKAVLKSMSIKADAPKWDVHAAMEVFKSEYLSLKGTNYIATNADYAGMSRLIDCLVEKITEVKKDTFVVTNEYVQMVLHSFLSCVAAMPNKWYFNNAFSPLALASKFNDIHSQLRNNSGHERAKRAIDCL